MESPVVIQSDAALPREKPPVKLPLGYMIQLDGLRALAIASVMLFHYTAGGQNVSSARRAIDEGWSIFAGMGVTLFFVLSRFLITGILLKCRDDVLAAQSSIGYSLRQFYVRRFLRIYPAYYLVIAIALVFSQNRASLWWHAAYLSNFYFAHEGVMGGPLSPFWSLAVEEQFYLIWPLVVLLTPQKRLPAALICMIVGSIVYRLVTVLAGCNDITVGALPIGSLDALGAGALLAVSGVHRPRFEKVGLRLGSILWIALVATHLLHPMQRRSWSIHERLCRSSR